MVSHPRLVSRARRRFLRRQLLFAAGMALPSAVLSQAAASPVQVARLDRFIGLSEAILAPLPLLTLKGAVDGTIAARLMAALGGEADDFYPQLDQLDVNADSHTLKNSPLARRVLAAWFTGVVGGELVSYELALKYRVAADVLPVRTYCVGRPGSWSEKPQESW